MGYTVLLADNESIFRKEFSIYLKTLDGVSEVIVAENGREAILKASEHNIDFMFLNANLTNTDGCTVAAILKKSQPNIKLIMLSYMHNEDALKFYSLLGACHCLAKPFDFENVQVIWDTLRNNNKNSNAKLYNLKDVEELLIQIGCSKNLVGFKYLCAAIKLASDKNSNNYKIADIYSELALSFNTSHCNIERSIRYVIEHAWNHPNPSAHSQCIFGSICEKNHNRPTNKEFIVKTISYCQ